MNIEHLLYLIAVVRRLWGARSGCPPATPSRPTRRLPQPTLPSLQMHCSVTCDHFTLTSHNLRIIICYGFMYVIVQPPPTQIVSTYRIYFINYFSNLIFRCLSEPYSVKWIESKRLLSASIRCCKQICVLYH